MKIVWKCDHCSSTNVNEDVIKIHEEKCIFNPLNRHCYTCDNKYEEYESDYCKIYHNSFKKRTENFDKFYKVFDKEEKCDSWVNENDKQEFISINLEKLKNKLKCGILGPQIGDVPEN